MSDFIRTIIGLIRRTIKEFIFPPNPLDYYLVDKSMPELKYDPNNFGIDLYARETVHIQPHDNKPTLVPLNVIIKGEYDRVALIFPRSSLPGKTGTILGNSVGVIDVAYSGKNDELKACLINYTDEVVTINRGDRICQLVLLQRREISDIKLCLQHWGDKDRGGFGSTGLSAD